MKLYWGFRSIPEFAGLPLKTQKSLWRHAYPLASKQRRVRLAGIGCALLAGVGAFLGEALGSGLIGLVLGSALGGFLYGQVLIAAVRPYLMSAPSSLPGGTNVGAV